MTPDLITEKVEAKVAELASYISKREDYAFYSADPSGEDNEWFGSEDDHKEYLRTTLTTLYTAGREAQNGETFILTDLCMWEKNKQEGKNDTHAIIVIDEKTGQNRMIKGGSRIRFVDGEITEPLKQEDYNLSPTNKTSEV